MGTYMRRLAILVLASGFALVASAQPFTLGYRKVFPRFPSDQGAYPIEVSVKGGRNPVRGIVYIESGTASVSAPFELEAGGSKVATFYPLADNSYSDLKLGAETDQGSTEVSIPAEPQAAPGLSSVIGITDTAGILQFLPRAKWRSATCTPEEAPERSVGYRGLQLVILGAGAERMKDSAVAALKSYVLYGGTLVFVGGTNTPLINDPRWAGVVPVGVGRAVSALPPPRVRGFFGTPANQPVAAVQARALPGSMNRDAGEMAWVVSRRVGAGVVFFWACDPFESVNRTWSRRAGAVRESVELAAKLGAKTQVKPPEPWEATPVQRGADAFLLQVPDARIVIGGLALYGLLVVPLVLFGLNKLGRAPWAWVVLPLASIGFSAFIARSAQQVTKAEAGKATMGTLAFDNDSQAGIFWGTQQIFVPQAGPKDLRLQGVEFLRPTTVNQFEMPTRSPWRGVILDVGEIMVPRLDLPPLAFREFELDQVVPRPGTLGVTQTQSGLRLTNSTPWRFGPGSLSQGGQTWVVPELDAGKSVALKGAPRGEAGPRYVYSAKTHDAPIGVSFLSESRASAGATVVWTLDADGGAQ